LACGCSGSLSFAPLLALLWVCLPCRVGGEGEGERKKKGKLVPAREHVPVLGERACLTSLANCKPCRRPNYRETEEGKKKKKKGGPHSPFTVAVTVFGRSGVRLHVHGGREKGGGVDARFLGPLPIMSIAIADRGGEVRGRGKESPVFIRTRRRPT